MEQLPGDLFGEVAVHLSKEARWSTSRINSLFMISAKKIKEKLLDIEDFIEACSDGDTLALVRSKLIVDSLYKIPLQERGVHSGNDPLGDGVRAAYENDRLELATYLIKKFGGSESRMIREDLSGDFGSTNR